MIQELIAQGMSREDILDLYEESGTPRHLAEFIYALETGEIQGDVIVEDEAGNELPGPEEEMVLGGEA